VYRLFVVDLAPVAEIVTAHTPFAEGDIISALQDVEAFYGYLPRPAMDELARLSGLPVAKFYGVATFYAQFHLEPHGKHTVRLCRGTACHVRGSPKVTEPSFGTLESKMARPRQTCFLA